MEVDSPAGPLQLTCFGLCRGWDSIKGRCEKLGLEDPPDFKNPRNCNLFEPYEDGDGIRRICGAVGHGCESCCIHCEDNPDPWYSGDNEEGFDYPGEYLDLNEPDEDEA